MSLRVRSAEGELDVPDRRALEEGVRAGLVAVEDEVRVSDQSPWVPVRSLVARPARGFRGNHWYVFAGLLLAAWLIGFGLLGIVFVISCHAIWLTTMAPRGVRQRGMRWW